MRQDRRLLAIGVTVVSISIIGMGVTLWPSLSPQPLEVVIKPDSGAPSAATQARKKEVELRFEQAVAMLHAKQYDYAIKALQRVLTLSPRLAEAHVNMGYALLGKEAYQEAVEFFNTATEIKPMQVNAYYGLAIAYEGVGKLEVALGAMRTFIHLSRADNPYLTKARSALWEWEEVLKQQQDKAATQPPESSPE